MRFFIIIFSFCIATQAKAAQVVSDCQSFIANDNDLKNYPILKPDCTIDNAALAALKKRNPAMSYALSTQGSPDGVVKFTIPDGMGLKQITLRKKDNQLAQIEVARNISAGNFNGFISSTVTDTYTFDCSTGHCTPKVGMEHFENSNNNKNNMDDSSDSQLFDVSLCKKLKVFFADNPKATACLGDFEKKSADLLNDYQADRVNLKSPMGMDLGGGYPFPVVFGGALFNAPLATKPNNDRIIDYFEKNPTNSSKRSTPLNRSKLALAMSLNNDCANDKRLTSTINPPSSDSATNKKQKSGAQ